MGAGTAQRFRGVRAWTSLIGPRSHGDLPLPTRRISHCRATSANCRPSTPSSAPSSTRRCRDRPRAVCCSTRGDREPRPPADRLERAHQPVRPAHSRQISRAATSSMHCWQCLYCASSRAAGKTEVTLLDIGSGGGYPGPSRWRRAARTARCAGRLDRQEGSVPGGRGGVVADALRAAPEECRRPLIEALAERAEDLADEPDQREVWDMVVARAVGTVAECAELGLPLARRSGHVVIWKRASDDCCARVAASGDRAGAPDRPGRRRRAAIRFVELDAGATVGLPGSCLVVIRKVRPTPDRYPRSAGETATGDATLTADADRRAVGHPRQPARTGGGARRAQAI